MYLQQSSTIINNHQQSSTMSSSYRSNRLCRICNYYPATECNGKSCMHCVTDYKKYLFKLEKEKEEERVKQENIDKEKQQQAIEKKEKFLKMAENATVQNGKSFADMLKKK